MHIVVPLHRLDERTEVIPVHCLPSRVQLLLLVRGARKDDVREAADGLEELHEAEGDQAVAGGHFAAHLHVAPHEHLLRRQAAHPPEVQVPLVAEAEPALHVQARLAAGGAEVREGRLEPGLVLRQHVRHRLAIHARTERIGRHQHRPEALVLRLRLDALPDVLHEAVQRVGDVVDARLLAEAQQRHAGQRLQVLKSRQRVFVVHLRHLGFLVVLEVRRNEDPVNVRHLAALGGGVVELKVLGQLVPLVELHRVRGLALRRLLAAVQVEQPRQHRKVLQENLKHLFELLV
mmetsp:Transcript_61/g.140  ORF Transcript_61/g.140 Transcript_61/m.140 type:complete len:290 (-) Transcript_61:709-1578(-)